MAVNPRINVDNEDERKSNSFANILKLAARVALSKSDAGAIAVQQDMDLRDAEAKQYTDKALDYVDRLALPKLLQKRAAASKEEKFAELLLNTHGMSPEAVKALSNGGIGELENFYKQKAVELTIPNGSPLTGAQLNSIVTNASEFASDPRDVVQFIKERHEPMKAIMAQRQSMPDAAIFSSMFGSSKEMSNRKLSELPVYGDISALDMVRYAKGGGFEDTTEDEMAKYDLEQIDKITSPSRINRVTPSFAPYVQAALLVGDPEVQFSADNAVFKLFLVKQGIDIDNMGKDGSPVQFQGNTRILDPTASTPEVMTAKDNYKKQRNVYFNNYNANPNKSQFTAETTQSLITQFDNFPFDSMKQLKQFLAIIDPTKNQTFKSWDAFKVNDQIVTVKQTGYYDEL